MSVAFHFPTVAESPELYPGLSCVSAQSRTPPAGVFEKGDTARFTKASAIRKTPHPVSYFSFRAHFFFREKEKVSKKKAFAARSARG